MATNFDKSFHIGAQEIKQYDLFGPDQVFESLDFDIENMSREEISELIRNLKEVSFGEKYVGRYLRKIFKTGYFTESTLEHVGTGSKLAEFFKKDLNPEDQESANAYI